ncbi:MAG: hypothetical protein BGO69_01760 [Bacteroidetes bacterium 46-16]|nr:MAG: hypothetical protein BGO69_01760 [Bacteroidetes bacterium 46-16]
MARYLPLDRDGNPDQDFIASHNLSYDGTTEDGVAVYDNPNGDVYFVPVNDEGDDDSNSVRDSGDKSGWLSVLGDYVTDGSNSNSNNDNSVLNGGGYKGYGARGNNWGASPGANTNYGKGDYANPNNDYSGGYTDPNRDYAGGYTNPDQSWGYSGSGEKYGAGAYANSGQVYGVGNYAGGNTGSVVNSPVVNDSYDDKGRRNSVTDELILNKPKSKKEKLAPQARQNATTPRPSYVSISTELAGPQQPLLSSSLPDIAADNTSVTPVNNAVLDGSYQYRGISPYQQQVNAVGTYYPYIPSPVIDRATVLDGNSLKPFKPGTFGHGRTSKIDKLRNSRISGDSLDIFKSRYAPIDEENGFNVTMGAQVSRQRLAIGANSDREVKVTYRGIGVEYSFPDNSTSIYVSSLKISETGTDFFEPILGGSKIINERVEFTDVRMPDGSIKSDFPYYTYELIESLTFLGKKAVRRIVFDIGGNVLDDSYRIIYIANYGKELTKGKSKFNIGIEAKVQWIGNWENTPDTYIEYRDNNYYNQLGEHITPLLKTFLYSR